MNKITKLVVAVAAVAALTGCGRVDNMWSSVKSYTGTMERKVTLYNAQGEPMRTWVTDNEIQYQGPVAGFIDKTGVTVRVSGTFVIEGK